MVAVTSITPVVKHSADEQTFEINLKDLRGTFSDADVKLEFTEDGRLKSVNSAQTGQGEAALKTAISIAGTVAAGFAELAVPTYKDECAFIAGVAGGKGKSISVTYQKDISPESTVGQEIFAEENSVAYENVLHKALGKVEATVSKISSPAEPLFSKEGERQVTITARQPALVTIEVTGGVPLDPGVSLPLGSVDVAVAQLGKVYRLPLPTPVVFGKEATSLTFSDSGALTSIQYASTSASGSALNVVDAGIDLLKGKSTADKSAEVKAEADLIAQNQRLASCLADRANCK